MLAGEAATVVAHFQAHGVLFKRQRGLKYFRIGMFERVGQSLLLNAQQVFLNGRHQPARLAVDGEVTPESRSRRHPFDQSIQGNPQVFLLQNLWPECLDGPSRFAETLTRQFSGTTIVFLSLSRRPVRKGALRRFQLDDYARESLRERVVNVPSHPVSLFQHRSLPMCLADSQILFRHAPPFSLKEKRCY